MSATREGPVASAVAAVRARIAAACARADRDPSEVLLIGASKTLPADVVRRALDAGVTDFAENYVRELVDKSAAVPARWHFIGKLQRGTVRHVADHASVVHSGEPGRALEMLARRAAAAGRAIETLIEVDLTDGRQGVRPDALEAFAAEVTAMEGLRVVGLMTVPPATPDPEGARAFFVRLRELRDGLAKGTPALRELSMGMSADYEIAVEEGATMVRIGTALFGPRPAHAAPG
ncbi:MAG TPA: YggS family pyridoxal phosphate-dependent enzyme [Actinomycetota bacterium]